MKPITENITEASAIEISVNPLFQEFQDLVRTRLDHVPILNIGEDAIRYDFFYAAINQLGLNPWDLHIEYPAHEESFIPREDINSKRKEKPQIDLIINTDSHKLAFEFGLFRRNRNPQGSINKTARTLKMVNDFIRLGLHSHFTGHHSFFVCIADSFMLTHQLKCKIYDPFPGVNYKVTFDEVEKLKVAVKTERFFDERFLKKAEMLKLQISAKLIYKAEIKAKTLEHTTKALIWKIETENKLSKIK